MENNEQCESTTSDREGFTKPPGFHKEGMRLTLQKFQNRQKFQQLLLSEGRFQEGPELDRELDVTGLNFSAPQHRAVTALNYLLDQTDFKGNHTAVPARRYEHYHWNGSLPRLHVTYSEFFEACGLKRQGDGTYYGRQADQALTALLSLTNPWRVCYTRRNGKRNRAGPLYDAIISKAPLIFVTKFYKDIAEKTAATLRDGDDLNPRVTSLLIEFSPLWVDGIASFYLLKPVRLYEEIRRLNRGKRTHEAVYAFCDFLLTLNKTPFIIAERTLEEKLWLDRYRWQRQPKRIRAILDCAYRTAKELGLLDSYEPDEFGKGIIFSLNPAKCQRIKPPLAADNPGVD